MTILSKLSGPLCGILAIIILILSTTFFFIPILFLGVLKLFPNQSWQVFCTIWIDKMIILWSDVNNLYLNHIQSTKLTITGVEELNNNDWYLVIANHQSWLDIVLLHRLFNRKIPVLKFFVKDQLKWVPLLGFSWWAMGCPFMKRYSKEYLLNNPKKQGKDIEATRKALELFKKTPSTIMNFVEGTRFTSEKKTLQNSPYTHLLKPKAGGISFVIAAMNEEINKLIDVTIVYADSRPSLWDFLCFRLKAIAVHVRQIPIPSQFTNPKLINNEQTQEDFRHWLNNQWQEKDELINTLRENFKLSSII